MSNPLVERTTMAGTPEQIWSVIDDPDALGRVLPGVESLVREAADQFSAVIAVKAGYMTVRADVAAHLREADPPRHLRIDLDGRARGLPGSFRVAIRIDLSPAGPRQTSVGYSVEIEASGTLATFGLDPLRAALRAQVGELVRNVEREISSGKPTRP